jgi:hypothetical protein
VETALYLPVKRFLEKLGFAVKGEIGGCDLVALSGDDPPVVVVGELKLSFNLELVLQAVDRAGACDEVWLAARMSANGKGRESDARYRNLCRRLGFGMLGVTGRGDVEVLVKPPTTSPRRDPKKRSRLVTEHQRRIASRRWLAPLRCQRGRGAFATCAKGFRTPAKFFCTTSMAGSPAPSAASTN